MNAQVHFDILRRLDTIKSSGLIIDYLVSWVGFAGKLDPKVCSWTTSGRHIHAVRERVMSSLEGLVPTENIIVKIDQD